jgi:hypothetical protein
MVVVWFLIGGVVEVLNNVLRRWSVARLDLRGGDAGSGHGPLVTGFVAALVVRLAMTSLVLVLAFRQGFAPGLAALVGYWICRWVIVWWTTRSLSRTSGIR